MKIQLRAFVMLLMVPGALAAQVMTTQLNQIRVQRNLVGMAVGVACGNQVLETYYGGLRRIPGSLPINAETYYRVASVSKSFSAAALMLLYDQGLFNLDDDISTALGYTVRNPLYPNTPITYRMVLSHTSSLQDGTGYNGFLTATFNQVPVPPISNLIVPGGPNYTSNMWRLEPPGSHFAYSNCNYGVIGTLVEALSGVRFDLFVRDNLLLPLGIPGSFNVDHLPDINNLAVLYRNSVPQTDNFMGVPPAPFNPATYTIGTNGLRFGPQGSLRCRLIDLLTFGQFLLNGGMHNGVQILSEESVNLMLSNQWTFSGNNGDNYFGLFRSWGLGIHRSLGITGSGNGDAVIPGVPMFGHPGEAFGLLSDLYIDPVTRLVLAFITNGYSTGGNYAPGITTTFYRVEEQVFRTIQTSYYDFCASLPADDCSEAPNNLQSTIQPGGVLLTWNTIPSSVGCRLQGNAVGFPQTTTQIDLPGSNVNQYLLPASQLQGGLNYRWRVACACSLSPLVASPFSTYQFFFFPGSGIAQGGEPTGKGNFELETWPNPAHQTLHVRTALDVAQFELYDLSGRLVWRYQSDDTSGPVGGEYHVPLHGVASGAYLLRATGSMGVATGQVRVQ
jgi:CubicO group peptidase (beta-lactamase class C family)